MVYSRFPSTKGTAPQYILSLNQRTFRTSKPSKFSASITQYTDMYVVLSTQCAALVLHYNLRPR